MKWKLHSRAEKAFVVWMMMMAWEVKQEVNIHYICYVVGSLSLAGYLLLPEKIIVLIRA